MKTVKIKDDLHRRIKTISADRGGSIEAITEAALLSWIEEDDKFFKLGKIKKLEQARTHE